MASFTISFQTPPQPHLHTYNRLLPSSAQPASIPPVFLSALAVREKVFVEEQLACPLEHHVDFEDARACHWVAFSSGEAGSGFDEEGRDSAIGRAIGTIRLIPFPHSDLHPEPDSRCDTPIFSDLSPTSAEELFFATTPVRRQDRKTSFHDGVEPYVKLGRWSVVPEWRGKGVGDALIERALSWVSGNAEWAAGCNGDGKWKGLVCVHAQEGAVGAWGRNGFVVDEGMGGWWEAGIRHLGMWRRVLVD
ncbi:hypothetical protein HYFRA_00004856 [Hymenoscyphus fraxineus]|uniref:N-acetyltransferase domain-containing protein n=1 Tax=Hymenoscyphus fraxineus TaxID=746836 RepID=A0A9N9KLN0_9HELO|nr:hypothetical protein HYFRA_00004856 [Hymenoscyphus fraxineus]